MSYLMDPADLYSPNEQHERREVAPLLPKKYFRVLEIGCGTGEFRINCNQGNEYWGIEPAEPLAKIAQEKLDTVLVGTYEEAEDDIPNNYFDLVICNDVIEHMPDHDEFLQSIRKKMDKGGSLVASIPNVRYLMNLWGLLIKKDWEYRIDGTILGKDHLRFFTKKSLVRVFSNNGFLVEKVVGLNPYRYGPPLKLLKQVIYTFAILLFGRDIRYLQFGVRVKKDAQPSK